MTQHDLGRVVLLACALAACPLGQGAWGAEHRATPRTVDQDITDYELHAVEERMLALPDGTERTYLAGILSCRSGRIEECTRLLSGVLPQLREPQPHRAATALEALAEAYSASYQYRQAADAYDDLEQHFAHELHDDVADDAALARMLSGVPPQTIAWEGPVRLAMAKNPIGLWTSDLSANGVRAAWLLDTGANYSVITRSFAQQLGLTALPGSATVGSGVTGLKSSLQVAVLPELHVGGATVHHVVALMLDDASLRIGEGPSAYQINAILGYPVLKALGRISFTPRGEFLAGDAVTPQAGGTPMRMRGLTPAIECQVEGERLLFTFDSGASSTDFSVRYFQRFRQHRNEWRTRTVESGGAGGSVRRKMYIQPSAVLSLGDATVTLKDVSVHSTPAKAGIDILFGNLGQDFLADVESVTLDFDRMTFALGAALPSHLPPRH